MAAIARLRRAMTKRAGEPHGLSAEVVISLTSFPPRFEHLHLSLGCLLDQTVRADRIILWIAESDYSQLPTEVSRLRDTNCVEIRTCDDLGPFKKLIPALEAFPNAFIVTADDDLYYPRNWLESLVRGFDGTSIVCRRASPVTGSEVKPNLVRGPAGPTEDMLPSSGAGILFPPGSLHPIATDRAFLHLCPSADDLWYYCMARMARRCFRKVVVGRENPISWLRSQECALWNENQHSDDVVFAKLMALYADKLGARSSRRSSAR